MSNSSLITHTLKSPNHSGKRTNNIDRITPHCVVGQLSAIGIAECFESKSSKASCNYGIGTKGDVALIVDECNRSWCTSSNDNDQRAVTIECASDTKSPYTMNSKVYNKLVDLCVDICKRNGKDTLIWIDDEDKALSYKPKKNEMIITVHRWFANKECPGEWLYSRLGKLADEVTDRINPVNKTLYRVQVGAFTNQDNAKKLQAQLKSKKYETLIVKVGNYYKVQVGAYNKKDNATKMLNKLKNDGYNPFITSFKM